MSTRKPSVLSRISTAAFGDLRTSIQELQAVSCHSSVESVLDLEATVDKTLTRRCFCPAAVFFGFVLIGGCPLLASLWMGTCTVDVEEMPFSPSMRARMALYLSTTFVGICVAYLCSHVERFRRNSRTHFWTSVYLTATSLSSTVVAVTLIGACDDTKSVRVIAFAGLSMSFQLITVTWLSVLKLRRAAVMIPKTERVGSACGVLYIILTCLAAVSHLVRILFGHVFNLAIHIDWGTFYVVGVVIALPPSIALTGCVIFLFEVLARAVIQEAADPDIGVDSAAELGQASCMARISAAIVAISGLSSVVPLIYASFFPESLEGVISLAALDIVCNTSACMALSGLCESGVDSMAIIELGVSSAAAARFRQIELKIRGVVGDSSGSALVIGALMRSASSVEVVERGIARFRCIRWEVLRRRPDIIMGGGPLDVLGPGKDDLYSLSEPCQLGECDAFFSHSWHDSAPGKWEALCCWCDEFQVVHGRFPRLWLDKVCIDQANIEEDLHCLPVFLAGCNTLFVLSGSTYCTRLWCVMEILIYRAMLMSDRRRSQPTVWSIGKDSQECQDIHEGWLNVDARKCECFKAEDKEQFMRVVRAIPGGVKRFNSFMQSIGQSIERDYIEDYDEVHVI